MRKMIGALALFLAVTGFAAAQTVTVEMVQLEGKPTIKFTNKTTEAQNIMYTVTGEKPAPIDIPANTEVTLPYAGKTQNPKIESSTAKPVAKPKALPKEAKSTSLGGAAPATGAQPAPAAGTQPAPAPGGKK